VHDGRRLVERCRLAMIPALGMLKETPHQSPASVRVIPADAPGRLAWAALVGDRQGANVLHVALGGRPGANGPITGVLEAGDTAIEVSSVLDRTTSYEDVILSQVGIAALSNSTQGLPWSGDEVWALPGAFLASGTRSVIASLWRPAGPVAMELARIYASRREEGRSPAAALADAQRQLLADAAPPAAWIGFTVYGEP
jgi:CHAT domain-containing protein